MLKFRYFKEKKQADNFLRRVYREMADGDVFWRIVFNKNLPDDKCGRLDPRMNVTIFRLDPTSGSVISTFLHECLHYFYNNEKCEGVILCMEKELIYWLSNGQFKNIFLKMAKLF